ncbi:MAG: chitobiase/beta-hexosaminidase C-terminal domain-containing protein, partial [Treponema sp.]|nr:chitobiase/beta-hexosaminidase C-terminal domain-containing protein [Treponema sp.]
MKSFRKIGIILIAALLSASLLMIGSCDNPSNNDGEGQPGLSTVATPTANPGAGEVESGQTVTLTTATEDAEIWYTINTTEPMPYMGGA